MSLSKSKEKKPKEKLYGNRIRAILKEKNMSQAELSDISGIPKSHLTRIINGQRRCISLPIAIKLALALQTPVENLFIYQKPVNEDDNN